MLTIFLLSDTFTTLDRVLSWKISRLDEVDTDTFVRVMKVFASMEHV